MRLPVDYRCASVSQAGESEMSEDEEEHNTSPTVEATSEAGTSYQERQEVSEVGTSGRLESYGVLFVFLKQ